MARNAAPRVRWYTTRSGNKILAALLMPDEHADQRQPGDEGKDGGARGPSTNLGAGEAEHDGEKPKGDRQRTENIELATLADWVFSDECQRAGQRGHRHEHADVHNPAPDK